MDAAADVEEMGGSCDGLILHPRRYWRLVAAGALPSLDAGGLRITRTRMIDFGAVLLGDFRAGVTLLDCGPFTVALRRRPRRSRRICAGLAVHLPQRFVLLDIPITG
jgi:hypothetical protein